MKIAVSSIENSMDGKLDPRFGRAKYLVIFDSSTNEAEIIDNHENYNAVQGAGIKTSELVVQKGCQAVVSGHFGPKAFAVLEQAKIDCFQKDHGTVKEAIADFKENNLTKVSQSTTKGHQ